MPEEIPNPFVFDSVAGRYERGRPAYHDRIMGRIRGRLELTALLPRALDVACGTGMSTRALREIAKEVVGVDPSAAMLAEAVEMPGVSYQEAAAENLPFVGKSFDLATVASGFHWFDRELFFPELRRVLRPDGWLVIYEFGLAGEALQPKGLANWLSRFFQRHPRTARNSEPITAKGVQRFGFELGSEEEFVDARPFTLTEFAWFLASQSNAVEAIERGGLTEAEFREEIELEAGPLFNGAELSVSFKGSVVYLQRIGRVRK